MSLLCKQENVSLVGMLRLLVFSADSFLWSSTKHGPLYVCSLGLLSVRMVTSKWYTQATEALLA